MPDLDDMLARLQPCLERAENRGWAELWKCLTSAFQLARRTVEDDLASKDLLQKAQTLTRKKLSKDQMYYALMLLITGGNSRQARKRAHEYSRVIEGLARENARTAKETYELLQKHGIKKLAQRGRQTADGQHPISDQPRRNRVVLELSEKYEALLLGSANRPVLLRFDQAEQKGAVYKLRVNGLKRWELPKDPVSAEQTLNLTKKRLPRLVPSSSRSKS